MPLKKHIPNFLTICNLSCGIAGIVLLNNDQPVYAAWMIWAGAFFDFLDGFAARLLKTSSLIGKELDSLADMITFSLLPAFIVFYYMQQSAEIFWLPYIAFLIAIFSALRLAKFNIDERQTSSFIGLPTPASAIVVSAIPYYAMGEYQTIFTNSYSLAGLSIVLSILMVSEIRLFSLKFTRLSWGMDKWRIIFFIFAFGCFITLKVLSFPVIILFYIIFSLLGNVSKKM